MSANANAAASGKPSASAQAKPSAGASAQPSTSKPISPSAPAPGGTPGATPSPAQGKPQLQEDAQHTGRSPYAGPRQLKLVRTLQAPAPKEPVFANSGADFQSDPAIAVDGTFYLSGVGGIVLALADQGKDQLASKWQYEQAKASGYHQTPVLLGDGTVVLGITTSQSPSTTIHAFKAAASSTEPQIAWKYDLGSGRMTSSMTIGPDGTVYAVGGSGQIAALGSDGKPKWTAQVGPSEHAAPALAGNGVIYLPSLDGNLYAVAPPQNGGMYGGVVWKFAFSNRPGIPVRSGSLSPASQGQGSSTSPTVGPDGTVYVGANNSDFYAVNPDGSLKWKFEADPEVAGIWSSAALSADGRAIYFGANKGGIYALNTADGSKVWQNPLFGGSVYASPTLDRNGTLYVGTTSGHVFALQASNGEQLSVFDTGGAVWTTPSIRPDGTLVNANRNGLVTVLSS